MNEIPKIETVRLGKTGLNITPLGIGTWAWGDKIYWNYGKGYSEPDIKDAFRACISSGINFFDTAEIYGWGRSERFLGKFIRKYCADCVTATKFFPYPYRVTKASLRRALKKSLGRLGMKKVDLYQIHFPLPPVSIETWMGAMADAADAGLLSAVGVSNYNAKQMRMAHAALEKRGIALASNQVEYSLLHREPETNGVLDACGELGVTLIAYSPVAMGVLTGKYSPENPPRGIRRFLYGKKYLARIQPLVSLMREIGRKSGKTPAQVAINWVMRKGAVPIPGVKNVRQAKENIGALGWSLASGEISELDSESGKLRMKKGSKRA